ncbi:MAG: 4Fe-4S binding protein [Prevotella sp.]
MVFLIGITLLFLDFTGTARHWFGGLAKLQLLPAILALNVVVVVALLILTLFFGRVYCSIICPLGLLQDVIARLGRIRRRNPYSYSKEKRWLRYGMFVVFVVLFVAGLSQLAILIAPYSAFGRIAQNLFQPVWIFGNNILASISESMNSYAFYHEDLWMRSLPTFIIALVTFIIIAVLAWRNGRTWCNTICPVGTLLSFFSRFSWLKIHFDEDACRKCGKCSRNCKAACIDFKTHTVDYSRCVVCGDCMDQCNFDALSYCHKKPAKSIKPVESAVNTKDSEPVEKSETSAPADNGRRSFLLAAAMATTAAAMAQKDKKVDGGLAVIEKKVAPKRHTPITPPGSWSAEHFAQHCTACQLCVAECPNGVLRPSADLEHLMQPTMSYERGFCRPECHRCSTVCPTGAIQPISRAEKSSIQLGHAVWVMHNCVAVTDKVNCGNCARHCPSGAIEMVPLDENDATSPMVPAVNESRCIGCGACEYVCPARPFSAIHVEGHEVHRKI